MPERDKKSIGELDKASEAVLTLLSSEREKEVGELVGEAMKTVGLKSHEAARSLYKLKELEMVDIVDPKPPKNALEFLFSSRAAWHWILYGVVLTTLFSIYVLPKGPPFEYLRYILGSLFVLYLPGASLVEFLFPGDTDLSRLVRLFLSMGMSLAIATLVGLVLNYTPWGIRLDPIAISLSLLTVLLSLGAIFRKYSYHISVLQGER